MTEIFDMLFLSVFRYFSEVDDLVSYLCVVGQQNKSNVPYFLVIDGLDYYVRHLQVIISITHCVFVCIIFIYIMFEMTFIARKVWHIIGLCLDDKPP